MGLVVRDLALLVLSDRCGLREGLVLRVRPVPSSMECIVPCGVASPSCEAVDVLVSRGCKTFLEHRDAVATRLQLGKEIVAIIVGDRFSRNSHICRFRGDFGHCYDGTPRIAHSSRDVASDRLSKE